MTIRPDMASTARPTDVRTLTAAVFTLAAVVLCLGPAAAQSDPLSSWRDGPEKTAILEFVAEAADPTSDGFVPEADRIAVFDNDGTLWSEMPVYFQFLFALDRAAELAAADPAWADTPALRAAADRDIPAIADGGEAALIEIVTATHSGLTVEEFTDGVRSWLGTARHPGTGRPYTAMVYRPMIELLEHLRDNGFEVYIVSGGGIDFMRAFAEDAYGVPPENVIGSMGEARYTAEDGPPRIIKDPGIAFIDDKAGKPLGIMRHVGKRPVLVGGNSDGDFEMLEWATAGDGPRLGLIVHHTDAAREFAYDRDSRVGRLSRALDAAPENGWLVIDMAEDWNTIWPDGN